MEYSQSCFLRSGDVSWKILDDKCILLNLASGNYYTLNKAGRFLWESLDGKKKLGEICEEISNHYCMDAETVRKDIFEIMDDLLEEGLAEENETLEESS